jgi:3-dehydroquinate synthase
MTITSKKYTYDKIRETEFLTDDDAALTWLSHFPSKEFQRFVLFYDEALDSVVIEKITTQLESHGKKIILMPLVASEDTKSLAFYTVIVEKMQDHYCSKGDLAIALGGGTIIDLVMFTASTYMRGMPTMLIPTTLVGQVDASSAGKTCLNTALVKNQLGTFYYPRFVYNNVNFLTTNSYYYFRQGLSEVLKYGLLDSHEILDELAKFKLMNDIPWLTKIVDLTIQSRVKICNIDAGVSNLGHTFGHAIEKITNYSVLHGDAINVGTVMALEYSVKQGLIKQKLVDEVVSIMKRLKFNLYIDKSWPAKKFVDLMMRDKKSFVNELNLILICGLADPYEKNGSRFYKADPRGVELFLAEFFEKYDYARPDFLHYINREEIVYEIS